jgi:hypothetical protein
MSNTNKDEKTKAARQNANVNSVVSPQGRAPFAQYYSERKINLANPQVARQLRHVDYFGLNYSTLMGAFIKSSQSGAIKHFDLYVDKLIETTKQMIALEIEKCEKVKSQYEAKGYTFVANVTPQSVTIKIFRNCLNDITDLIVDLDHLVTLLNHLEKTPYIKTQTLFTNISEFVMIPKSLSDKIFGLTKTLNDQFKFNAKSKTPPSSKIDFSKVNQLLMSYQTHQLEVLGKKDKPVKPQPASMTIQTKASPPSTPEKAPSTIPATTTNNADLTAKDATISKPTKNVPLTPTVAAIPKSTKKVAVKPKTQEVKASTVAPPVLASAKESEARRNW